MDIKLKEAEWFYLVSTVIGVGVFVFACSWDSMVGITINHNHGYGWMQILIIATSGMYLLWALTLRSTWNEYQKKIHGLENKNVAAYTR
jgi:hypothetical protein